MIQETYTEKLIRMVFVGALNESRDSEQARESINAY